jgi:hypothetical protein
MDTLSVLESGAHSDVGPAKAGPYVIVSRVTAGASGGHVLKPYASGEEQEIACFKGFLQGRWIPVRP